MQDMLRHSFSAHVHAATQHIVNIKADDDSGDWALCVAQKTM